LRASALDGPQEDAMASRNLVNLSVFPCGLGA
jgi:hypothetical protein